MRVLVVDDYAALCDLLRDALGDEGHEVATAGDGAQALALLARDHHAPPDVVLLDARLARLDGRGFLDAYRAAPGPHAAVIVMTAWPRAAAGDWPGAAAVVAKPFDLDALLRLVGRHASLTPGRRPPCRPARDDGGQRHNRR